MLKPFLTRYFLFSIVLYLVSLVAFGGLYCLYATYTTPTAYIELTEIEAAKFENGQIVGISDYQTYGQGFTVEHDADHPNTHQLVVPQGIDPNTATEADMLIISTNKSAEETAAMLETGTQKGRWMAALETMPCSDEPPVFFSAFAKAYPNVDTSKVPSIDVVEPLGWLIKAFFFGYIALIAGMFPVSIYNALVAYRKDQEWIKKLDDDRTELYRQFPGAMRLAGNAFYGGEFCLPMRRVDPTFDVTPDPEVKRPKLKRFGWQVLVIAGSLLFAFFASRMEGSDWVQNNFGSFYFGFVIMIVAQFLMTWLQTRQVAGRQETEINKSKAHHRKFGFHQWHDRVLNELGFVEIGDYQLEGAEIPIARTIYVSPQGNTLITLSQGSFCIDTVTNAGKFLETNSLLPITYEKYELSQRSHLRSAKDIDFLQALENHDKLVGEFTYGGSVQEAQFTKERFPRFLSWATRKDESI
ncbi:hypothetical protein N9Y42_08585 [Mariniblastus sp.]|nr:hypothetical protein [Mariniblastus sp.]